MPTPPTSAAPSPLEEVPDIDACKGLPVSSFTKVGIKTGKPKHTSIRRTDNQGAQDAFGPRSIDGIFTCDAGAPLGVTITDYATAEIAGAAVESDTATAGTLDPVTGSREPIVTSDAYFGYVVINPANGAASVEWQHDDLAVAVLMYYMPPQLTRERVTALLADAVTAMDAQLR